MILFLPPRAPVQQTGGKGCTSGILPPVFVGHFGVGLAAKTVATRTSLGWLIGAPLLLDLLWPIFLLLGWESVRFDPEATVVMPLDFVSYPISHSLLTATGWAVLAAMAYWTLSRYRTGAIAVGACVLSHWVLDWIVHRPDLPLYPDGPKVGLALWNSVPATLAVEAVFFITGVWLYQRSTRATSKGGQIGWWAFVGFLLLVYAMNLLGPLPERVEEVAFLTLTLWLMPIWAWSFDRRRTLTVRGSAASSR